MHVILCFLFILLSFNSLPAQVDPRPSVDASDLRSRVASYEPTQSRRGDAVTMVDPRLRPFYHGVASGDPMERSVVLWTRVTPENGASSVDVEWRIATDVDLKNVVAQGQGTATSAADFCFKVITTEVLQPATTYYYGFTAYGRHSLTGRTRTLAAGSYAHARFAVVTCANYPMGFFNAYGRIAARNDLDAVLHMGDYIYEYDADTSSFGGGIGARLGRMHEPDKELIELADYRARYAQYRLDPDLMRLHQQHAMIHIWDDHESANGSYRDGAENHSPDEGEWSVRKTVSQRVHSEWMPVRRNASDPLYRSFAYGDLVDITMLDTRLEGRDKQVSGVSASSPQASKDSLNDVNRRMISPTQFAWLQDILENSNARWRLIGSQVLFTPCDSDPVDTTYLFQELGPILSAIIRARINDVQYFFDYAFKGDVWSNYPAQRDAVASMIKTLDRSGTVIVSGDLHIGMAFDGRWINGQMPICEFMTPSISAGNFDEILGADPVLSSLAPVFVRTIDTTLKQNNTHLRWQDLNGHGYLIVDLTKDRAQGDWYYVDTLLVRSDNEDWRIGYSTTGDGFALLTSRPADGKSIQDVPTPPDPPEPSTSVDELRAGSFTVLGYGPNPVHDRLYVSFTSTGSGVVTPSVVDLRGTVVASARPAEISAGLHSIVLDLHSVASGQYSLVIALNGSRQTIPIIVQR